MGFHNPFLKDGLIKFPDNGSVVKHVEKWAKVRGDKVAYRFLDYLRRARRCCARAELGGLRHA